MHRGPIQAHHGASGRAPAPGRGNLTANLRASVVPLQRIQMHFSSMKKAHFILNMHCSVLEMQFSVNINEAIFFGTNEQDILNFRSEKLDLFKSQFYNRS